MDSQNKSSHRIRVSFYGFLILLILIIELTIFIKRDDQITLDYTDFQNSVDKYLEGKEFNGAVLIAQRGNIIVNKGYGMADLEQSIPNNSDTVFRVGSFTKQFTAMAILLLQEEGLLNVQDPISKYINGYPDGDAMTIAHLLTHTSGTPQNQEVVTSSGDIEEIIEQNKKKSLDFKPGDQFAYSNTGYGILGYIIEQVSQMTYEQYLQKNIFDKVGMSSSGIEHKEYKVFENRAWGYTKFEQGNTKKEPFFLNYNSAAGLYTNTHDLFLWDQMLYKDDVFSKELIESMYTDYGKGYGYGWFINKDNQQRTIYEHSGIVYGIVSNIVRYPEEQALIIVIRNVVPPKLHDDKVQTDLAKMLFELE